MIPKPMWSRMFSPPTKVPDLGVLASAVTLCISAGGVVGLEKAADQSFYNRPEEALIAEARESCPNNKNISFNKDFNPHNILDFSSHKPVFVRNVDTLVCGDGKRIYNFQNNVVETINSNGEKVERYSTEYLVDIGRKALGNAQKLADENPSIIKRFLKKCKIL